MNLALNVLVFVVMRIMLADAFINYITVIPSHVYKTSIFVIMFFSPQNSHGVKVTLARMELRVSTVLVASLVTVAKDSWEDIVKRNLS